MNHQQLLRAHHTHLDRTAATITARFDEYAQRLDALAAEIEDFAAGVVAEQQNLGQQAALSIATAESPVYYPDLETDLPARLPRWASRLYDAARHGRRRTTIEVLASVAVIPRSDK